MGNTDQVNQRNTVFPRMETSKKFPQRRGYFNIMDSHLNNIPAMWSAEFHNSHFFKTPINWSQRHDGAGGHGSEKATEGGERFWKPNSCSLLVLVIQEVKLPCVEKTMWPALPVCEKISAESHCTVKPTDVTRLDPTSHGRFLLDNKETSLSPWCSRMRIGLRDSKRDSSEGPIVKITWHRPMWNMQKLWKINASHNLP